MRENSTKLPDDLPLVCLGQITGTQLTTGSVRGSSSNSIPNCKDDKHGENRNSKKQYCNGIFSSSFLTSFKKPLAALYLKIAYFPSKLWFHFILSNRW